MTKLNFVMVVLAATLFASVHARAETTECTEITSLPATITVQGIYCFKQNLVTAITSGNAIEIQTNNVTIDMNGFKLGGSAAGAGTQAHGVYASGRKNITIRNGNIRGFYSGIHITGSNSSGHVIEQIRFDGNKNNGLRLQGKNNIIRNNHVINTGESTQNSAAYGMYVTNAFDTLIADNVISVVSESATSTGIYIITSSRIEVRRNSVFDLITANLRHGIYMDIGSGITVQDNHINNKGFGAPATTGIFAFSSNTIACLDNVTVDYATETSGCDLLDGHRSL